MSSSTFFVSGIIFINLVVPGNIKVFRLFNSSWISSSTGMKPNFSCQLMIISSEDGIIMRFTSISESIWGHKNSQMSKIVLVKFNTSRLWDLLMFGAVLTVSITVIKCLQIPCLLHFLLVAINGISAICGERILINTDRKTKRDIRYVEFVNLFQSFLYFF